MGLGTSIFLVAVGAILDFAVDVTVQGVDLHTIGAILMAVGALGIVLSLFFWESWGGFGRQRRQVVTDVDPVGRRRTTTYDDVVS